VARVAGELTVVAVEPWVAAAPSVTGKCHHIVRSSLTKTGSGFVTVMKRLALAAKMDAQVAMVRMDRTVVMDRMDQ
jgi:hypothetical protein